MELTNLGQFPKQWMSAYLMQHWILHPFYFLNSKLWRVLWLTVQAQEGCSRNKSRTIHILSVLIQTDLEQLFLWAVSSRKPSTTFNSTPTTYPERGSESSYMRSIMQSFSRQKFTFRKSDSQLHISLQEFKCQRWYMITAPKASTKQDFSFLFYRQHQLNTKTYAESNRFTQW